MFYVLSFFLYIKGRVPAAKNRGKMPLPQYPGMNSGSKLKMPLPQYPGMNSGSKMRIAGRVLQKHHYLWFTGSALAWVLALGCKQTAASLPFVIFLYEWHFFQDTGRDWLKHNMKFLLGAAVLFFLIALIFFGLNPLEKISVLRDYSLGEFTLTERVLTQFRVVIYYLSLLFYPHPSRLNLDHDFPISHSLINPFTTLFSLGTIITLVGLALFMKKKEPLFSFCILWYFGNLLIESSVIPLAIIFEHLTYLPSMLVSLCVVTTAYRFIRKKWVVTGLLCVIGLVLSTWTYERNGTWSDPLTLWRDCVEKSPKKARPHYNLGFFLAEQDRISEAITHFSEALRINPDYAEAHNNLGIALAGRGDLKEAVRHYSEALRLKPDHAKAHHNLGNVKVEEGDLDGAIGHYSRALQLRPDYADVHNSLGYALAKQGNRQEAVKHYLEALALDPDYVDAHYNLGVALAGRGDLKEAVRHYTEILRIDPRYTKAHYKLGLVMAGMGKPREAIDHFSEVLKSNPDHARAAYNLGLAYSQLGAVDKAVHHLTTALRVKPDYWRAHYTLGVLLGQQGKLDEAIGHFSETLRFNPSYAQAHYALGLTLLHRGDPKRAAGHFSEALRIDPDHAGARKNLETALGMMDKSGGKSNRVEKP